MNISTMLALTPRREVDTLNGRIGLKSNLFPKRNNLFPKVMKHDIVKEITSYSKEIRRSGSGDRLFFSHIVNKVSN